MPFLLLALALLNPLEPHQQPDLDNFGAGLEAEKTVRGRSEKAQEPGYYSQAVPAWTGPPPPPDNPRTLAPRAEAAALARTTRLLYISAAVGLDSLAGVCAVVLPWRMATTQGQWVAFALLAACSFGWLCTPIITSGYLQDLKKTRLAWFALLALAIVHAGMAAYFEAASLELRDGYVQRVCSETRRDWDAVESCRGGTKGPVIAFGLVGAILPVCSAPLLFLLWRSFSHLPQSHTYDTLFDNEVPPGWHVAPAELAPDSSASESDEEAKPALLGHSRKTSGPSMEWHELGKPGGGRSVKHSSRLSWSAYREKRKRRAMDP
ncbi:putative NADH dehydrogenase subunit [Rhodotorula toruloides ATCC 204091]|uniref:BY PROTMAP: gi/342319340/gb/EGU11289.1/ putative NADH dehydrogenase subunit [Rhodotorula glutinis ATCC 204091] n=1 Tax=Rhodotorula toruloides TaxID=5286 RepID=A0A0K3C693_RHOTO|nr:putative NADH dehydrogenase subunit [Rhodotorula toruloides ATCC 204091]